MAKSRYFAIFLSLGVNIMKTASLISLIISISVLALFIVLGRILHRKTLANRKDFARRKSYVLTAFQIFLIGFFLCTAILFYPLYYFDYFEQESGIVRVIKSILLSIHNTMRLFILDGDFEIFKETASVVNMGDTLSLIYTVYAAFLFVIAPVMTAGFVLSFFKNAAAFVKLFFSPKADIYVMSALNERSIALAEDILTNPDILGKKTVIFADVFEKEEEENFELVEQAKRLGAICFKKDLTEISLRPFMPNIQRKMFFVSDDGDENVKQALVMIARCKVKKRYNTENTHFYVLSSTVESEALLNSTDSGDMCVRRVYQPRNLALTTLKENSIFETNIEKDGQKLINIAIVGLGNYGKELLKTISWVGQMDGYVLQMHVFDAEPDCESKIKCFAPEIVLHNHKKIEGEPFYDIFFHDNMDVKSPDFLEELSKIQDLTAVYVVLGDDELNIETAMRMRMQFGRDKMKFNRVIPPIYAVVYSSIKSQTFKKNGGLTSMKKDKNGNPINYGIHFIGSMNDRYSLGFLEQAELEEDGLKVHLFWSDKGKPEQVAKDKKLYEKYEYYRRSSVSQALHIRFRENLGLLYEDDLYKCKVLEHKRWNAYMRSEGYVLGDKDDIAKTHHNLVPYEELSEEDKNKDIIYKLED